MELSESYRSTILRSLVHENSYQAIDTIKELERIGWKIPAWVLEDINRYEKQRLADDIGDILYGEFRHDPAEDSYSYENYDAVIGEQDW